eukprot:Clim_evm2s241 gene=Clim_evmTU2s241
MERLLLLGNAFLDFFIIYASFEQPQLAKEITPFGQTNPHGSATERLVLYFVGWLAITRLGAAMSKSAYSMCIALTSYLLEAAYISSEMFHYKTMKEDEKLFGVLGFLGLMTLICFYSLVSGRAGAAEKAKIE